MRTELTIEGMKCPKCSGRVEKALAALDGVRNVKVCHESGIAEIEGDCDVKILCDAVIKSGYKVVSSKQEN